MDFGGGFATGIGAGIGSGMAIGVSEGRKRVRRQIREYVDSQGITVLDRFGKPIKLEEFLDEACGPSQQCCSRNKAWLWAVLVLGVAAAAGVVVYLNY